MRPLLKQVLTILPKLTEAELAEVGRRLSVNRALAGSSAAEGDDWLFSGIVAELKRRGILAASAKPAKSNFRRAAPNYDREAAAARDALAKGLSYQPTPVDLLSLGALAARSLADDLEGGPAPICLAVMAQNVQRVVGAVDKDFPDYLRCRQLGFILKGGFHGAMQPKT